MNKALGKAVIAFASLFFVWSHAVAQTPCPVDQISQNADATLTIEGVLLSRYASGLRGLTLRNGISPSRDLSGAEAIIGNNRARLDLDGDGNFNTVDAILSARLLAGFTGDRLTAGLAIPPTARRKSASDINAYVYNGCPTDDFAAKAAASRFLMQATFGPTVESIQEVLSKPGATADQKYARWIDDQWAMSPSKFVPWIDARQIQLGGGPIFVNETYNAFWSRAVQAPDQLRQRCAFALSEIFVVSVASNSLSNSPRGFVNYMDTLMDGCTGNFRDLIERVSTSPIMGLYLSHMQNRKEDLAIGRVPDENYAREIMQLFTIGLIELNEDGTPKLDSQSREIETYDNDDVTGLAKVFTGWGPLGPDLSNRSFNLPATVPPQIETSMVAYPQWHSVSEKKFLGVTIAPQSTPDPQASLRIALDRLFNHPNTPPFIATQLIKRFVTSNPSPQYVLRVASVFKNNGAGVRGDMKATIKAVLMDNEARSISKIVDPKFGKVREPIVRTAHMIRALNIPARSDGIFTFIADFGQTPWKSPSVFNYFRPGYVAPGSKSAGAGLVAPELQITSESTNATYINRMQDTLTYGVGFRSAGIVAPAFTYENTLYEIGPQALIDHLNIVLLAGQMSPELYRDLRSDLAVARTRPSVEESQRWRIAAQVLLIMSSLDYIVQK
jgi:uncharacterized protein (DUF1800 family)